MAAYRLASAHALANSSGTEYIYQPGWVSTLTALVAGTAGTLSLTSAKLVALVGVFISVTTIPAAGNGALAWVFGRFQEAGGSALQLLINLTGIVIALACPLPCPGRASQPQCHNILSHARCTPGTLVCRCLTGPTSACGVMPGACALWRVANRDNNDVR